MGIATTAKQEPKTTPIRKGLQGVLNGARGRCECLCRYVWMKRARWDYYRRLVGIEKIFWKCWAGTDSELILGTCVSYWSVSLLSVSLLSVARTFIYFRAICLFNVLTSPRIVGGSWFRLLKFVDHGSIVSLSSSPRTLLVFRFLFSFQSFFPTIGQLLRLVLSFSCLSSRSRCKWSLPQYLITGEIEV